MRGGIPKLREILRRQRGDSEVGVVCISIIESRIKNRIIIIK